jgi:chromosomal replication initiation ATPase DnaA
MNPIQLIQAVVGFELQVQVSDMISKSRRAEFVYARQVAIWLARRVHGTTGGDLSVYFQMDTSSIWHAEHALEDRRTVDRRCADDIKRLTAHLEPILAFHSARSL